MVYIRSAKMQVSKWGNSLAIRIPGAVAAALDLKEGDHVEVSIVGSRHFEIGHDRRRREAIETLRALRRPLPDGFRFDRDDAHER
jgi:antitoxin MazE